MLYLVRKLGESIVINNNIEVKVIEVKGKTVKLGFEFPASATVLRKEIHDRVVQENMAAQLGDSSMDFTDALSALNTKNAAKDDNTSPPADES